ncbi:MAG: dienelactone hydrolase family protein [Gemmatimonadota bacterium]
MDQLPSLIRSRVYAGLVAALLASSLSGENQGQKFGVAVASAATAAQEAELVALRSGNGTENQAYVKRPEAGAVRGGVLIVHDWFGVTDATHDAAKRLSELGYVTLVVDLYDGQSGSTHAEAFALMKALDAETAQEVIRDGLRYLADLGSPGRKLAVLGFSAGTVHALEAVLRDPEAVSATVLVYGDAESDPARLSALASPVLFIMGSKDDPDGAFRFLKSMEEAERLAEVFIYPGARHAFAQPLFNDGKNLDPTATRVSWMLMADFLARHMAPSE